MSGLGVVSYTWVDVDDLRTDDGSGELPADTRRRIGPALSRAFDDLRFDTSQCACCDAPVGPGLTSGDDHDDVPVWRMTLLAVNVNTGLAWALCEDCGSALAPDPAKALRTDG